MLIPVFHTSWCVCFVCSKEDLSASRPSEHPHRGKISKRFVCVFFTLTDRASTMPSNIRGCQSGTWSAGQENIRGKYEGEKAKTTKRKEKRHNSIYNILSFSIATANAAWRVLGWSFQSGSKMYQACYGHPRYNFNLVRLVRFSLPLSVVGCMFLLSQPRGHTPTAPTA